MSIKHPLPLLPLLVSSIALFAEDKEPEVNPFIAPANRTLAFAGLPSLPEKATEMQCYSWSGLSAGIYASFELPEPDLSHYLATLPPGVEKASPIPANLLSPPNSSAPWFTPGDITSGTVFYRGRITNSAPETYRLYVDTENSRVYLFYTWNNKRTYP
jgi:hypothetical protein